MFNTNILINCEGPGAFLARSRAILRKWEAEAERRSVLMSVAVSPVVAGRIAANNFKSNVVVLKGA